MSPRIKRILFDLLLVSASTILTAYWAKIGFFNQIITSAEQVKLLGSFIAGIFYTSFFTIVPATVAISEISKTDSSIYIALFGATGALIGDLLIFRFMRDRLSQDIVAFLSKRQAKTISKFSQKPIVRWLSVVAGAIAMASPLPDELGIFLMGFSKTRNAVFIPVSFAMNFLGVLSIILISKNFT